MTKLGQGLQVVNVTPQHKFELNTQALESLLLQEDVKDLPVVVVSVAGAYRGGKSFLLNFFLRYLSSPRSARRDGSWLGEDSEPLTGFNWRHGVTATTMGILMWSEPFITTLPNGDQVAILLVDTQGNFDSTSTVRDNSTIFALSTLVSSIQIYNLSKNIKEDDLQHLELFTEYGKLVNSAGTSSKAFQVLEFLVRDWEFVDDYDYGAVGGEQLLQRKLQITDTLPRELKELRQHILTSFEKVSCFLMPHPGDKVLRKHFKGDINDIDPDFRMQLVDLTNSIFGSEKLLPKKINGQQVKARELCNYFKTYMELFNSDKTPSPTNILAATVKAGFLTAVGESHDIYEKGMDSEVGPKQLAVPQVDLKVLHERYVKLATEAFINKKKMGSPEEAAEYLEKLTKNLNVRLEQFIQSNKSKIQDIISKANEVYDEEIKKVSKGELLCVHAVDLEKVHNAAAAAAIKVYDTSRKRITQQKDDVREKIIQDFEKKLDLQKKINEQNNNIAVTMTKIKYWTRMQEKAFKEPLLSDEEFRKEHNDALEQALKDFESKRNMPNQYNLDVYKSNLTRECLDSFVQLKALNKSTNKLAMQAAIEVYDKYMKDYGSTASKCLHPDDLEKHHQLAVCQALNIFRPKKECSNGFNYNDEDETTLNEILDTRHNDFKKNNDSANETAVLLGYNEYRSKIDNDCGFSLWWLTVIPYVVNLANRNSYHQEAKKIGVQRFYEQRLDAGYHSTDVFMERLDRLMEQYFNKNYNNSQQIWVSLRLEY